MGCTDHVLSGEEDLDDLIVATSRLPRYLSSLPLFTVQQVDQKGPTGYKDFKVKSTKTKFCMGHVTEHRSDMNG